MGLTGLPEHNVFLSGDINAPAVVNSASKKILGYTLYCQYAIAAPMTKIELSFLSVRNGRTDAGIAPGSFQAINPLRTVIGPDGPAGPPVSVSLDAVIFADGELVGPDRTDTFAFVTAKLRAERDLHTQFLASEHGSSAGQSIAWNTILAAANGQITVPDGITKKAVYLQETRTKAKELLKVRAKQNDAAAFALAHRSEIYPTIWRQQ